MLYLLPSDNKFYYFYANFYCKSWMMPFFILIKIVEQITTEIFFNASKNHKKSKKFPKWNAHTTLFFRVSQNITYSNYMLMIESNKIHFCAKFAKAHRFCHTECAYNPFIWKFSLYAYNPFLILFYISAFYPFFPTHYLAF